MSEARSGEAKQGRLQWLASPLLWLVTTITAAALGVIVNRYFERPGPSVLIADIAISSHYNARFPETKTVTVPVKDELFAELEQNVWLESMVESTVDLGKFLDGLTANKDRINSILQQLNVLRNELPEMRAELEGPSTEAMANAFFNQWNSLSDLICSQINGDIARGTFRVKPLRTDDKAPSYFIVRARHDDDGSDITEVGQIGTKRTFSCYPNKFDPDSKLESNVVIPQALLHFDQRVLSEVLEDVAHEADKYEAYQQVQQGLTTYIQGFSRWAVAILFTNSGGQALSFKPDATLFIDSKDYQGFGTSTAIILQSRTESGDLQPVTVAAGESKLVTFVSPNLIIDNGEWKSFLDMFRTKARKSFVVVHPEGDVWANDKDFFSPVTVFGAASGGVQVGESTVESMFHGN